MKYNHYLPLSFAIPLLFTACAATNTTNVIVLTEQDLQHHNWELTQIDGQALVRSDVAIRASKAPRLEIGENMHASGNAGCNNFFGQAELKNNQLRIEKMGMTMKMCIGDIMQTEQAITKTLSDWSDITLTKEGLELKNQHHTLTFVLHDWVN